MTTAPPHRGLLRRVAVAATAVVMAASLAGSGAIAASPAPLLDRCADPSGMVLAASEWVACTGRQPDGGILPLVEITPDGVQHSGSVFAASARPGWAHGDFWAPHLVQLDAGFRLYYASRDSTGRFQIGVASAPQPGGPWRDLGRPLFGDRRVGLIDPSVFTFRGRPWLLYKENGNEQGRPSRLMAAELRADGRAVTGPAHHLLTSGLPWERGVVENPMMVEHAGRWYLLYSAGPYGGPDYRVGVARSDSPLGPFHKRAEPLTVPFAAWNGVAAVSPGFGPAGVLVAGYPVGAGSRATTVARLAWDREGWPELRVGRGLVAGLG
jgi:arabinan endo-1,5-alpha-L-arabinosidase